MKTIFIVDDDESNLELLKDLLMDDYEVACFLSPSQCLEHFELSPADIVLLDVNMPEISGLDLCKKLLAVVPECPILFISGYVSDKDRIAGYEAGGYDYISKPINLKELVRKLDIIAKSLESKSEIIAEKDNMTSAFMDALTSSGEQGIILQFASRIFELRDYQGLAEEVLSSIEQFDLRANVLIKGKQDTVYQSCTGACSPMIINVLELLREKQRIYEFNGRVQFNEKNISVLINEQPDDPEVAGRFKDHILLLLRIASECVKNLDMRVDNVRLLDNMREISADLKAADSSLRQRVFTSLDEINGEIDRIESDVQFFALSEEQEQKLLASLAKTIELARISSDKTVLECNRLSDIVTRLNQV